MFNAENSITVMVVQTPATPKSVILEEGATIADAIREAGFSSDGQQVRYDGEQVTDLSTEVENGSRVILSRQIKGN